ncbi:hypothetical protein RHSIM_Rhsim02G0013600 [Rhododendron simsii]|uniref:NAD(P)-binding Rossmann-fold superfamily protein n=1 Tax=Rhododendron simsii TaxID=118357 RepID=A0A834HBB8_RHOSS|nr:hypothetical protein RHSIM_Rhsim02G0013600 [Rhododendron simsii]
MGTTAITFTPSATATPAKLSRSTAAHGCSNRLNSPILFRNPNFKTKRSSSKSLVLSTPLHAKSSSVIGAANEAVDASSPGSIGANDLLIVGPGVLGKLVAEKWREDHPGCQIFGQTMTTDHHNELAKIGINPLLKGSKATQEFPYVVFCAPTSRSLDYPGDVREAASSWSGEGSFIFTSSSAPFDCDDNGPCDEDFPVVPIGRRPRTDVLLKAEKVVLESDGCVLRLAGLYISFYEINMSNIFMSTHDAASLLVAIMKKKLRGCIFLGCDNHPLSRQEVMDLVNKSGKFSQKFEGFTGTNDPLGKKLNNEKTRKEIGWEPKYPSFAQFLGVSE